MLVRYNILICDASELIKQREKLITFIEIWIFCFAFQTIWETKEIKNYIYNINWIITWCIETKFGYSNMRCFLNCVEAADEKKSVINRLCRTKTCLIFYKIINKASSWKRKVCAFKAVRCSNSGCMRVAYVFSRARLNSQYLFFI